MIHEEREIENVTTIYPSFTAGQYSGQSRNHETGGIRGNSKVAGDKLRLQGWSEWVVSKRTSHSDICVTCTKIATARFINTLIKGTRIQHKESKGMFTWRWGTLTRLSGVTRLSIESRSLN